MTLAAAAPLSPDSQYRLEYLQEQQQQHQEEEEGVEGEIVDIDGDEEGEQNHHLKRDKGDYTLSHERETKAPWLYSS